MKVASINTKANGECHDLQLQKASTFCEEVKDIEINCGMKTKCLWRYKIENARGPRDISLSIARKLVLGNLLNYDMDLKYCVYVQEGYGAHYT